MSPSTETFEARRRHTWEIWGGAILLFTVAFGLVWLVWGFRWPPTADVLSYHPEQTASDAGRQERNAWWSHPSGRRVAAPAGARTPGGPR